MKQCACDMRGFLSFLVLWILSKKAMSGAEIAKEIERRKGCKPNPGTIYPALKELARKKAIALQASGGKKKIYRLTPAGREELEVAVTAFTKTFHDVIVK